MPLGAFKAALMGTAGATAAGDVVLLYDTDHSNVASVDISSNITSTYGEYIFKFYNLNPATDAAQFQFQVNATDDPGGDYDVSLITSTYFVANHSEADVTGFDYSTSADKAQAATFQQLSEGLGNGADESSVGELHLFNPASTTYVKHFYATMNIYGLSDYTQEIFVTGYINDTTAIDDIRFKMSSGNFDGTIKMWGVK